MEEGIIMRQKECIVQERRRNKRRRVEEIEERIREGMEI